MASTNFKIFNEDHSDERTFNDSEYANATQRQSGVIPGIALSRLHNKLYFQVSSMCKAIADFIVGKGYDCNDDDVKTITENLGKAIVANGEEVVKSHNESTDAHGAMTSTIKDTLVPTSDTDTLRNQVSELANRIKAATGASGWKEAPAATLASLSKMFANLATGADVTWDGKKFTNHRLGITGLMDQNGYICFGPNCGGLIIQWGIAVSSKWEGVLDFTYPIALSSEALYAIAQESNPLAWRDNASVSISSAFYSQTLTSCQVITKTITNGGNVLDVSSSTRVLIIGY
nr:MAG TPA: Putative tail fiber protein fold, Tail fiber, receptor [Caudoviricetes sp.]